MLLDTLYANKPTMAPTTIEPITPAIAPAVYPGPASTDPFTRTIAGTTQFDVFTASQIAHPKATMIPSASTPIYGRIAAS
jgi:hypothetical protein